LPPTLKWTILHYQNTKHSNYKFKKNKIVDSTCATCDITLVCQGLNWGQFDKWMEQHIWKRKFSHLWILVWKVITRDKFYTLRNDKPITYVFSHLMLASKFLMPPIVQTLPRMLSCERWTCECEQMRPRESFQEYPTNVDKI
jgi:hypothetical protein